MVEGFLSEDTLTLVTLVCLLGIVVGIDGAATAGNAVFWGRLLVVAFLGVTLVAIGGLRIRRR